MTEILECFRHCPVEPVGYRLVLGQLPKQRKSEGGIVIPESSDTSRAQEVLGCISQVVKIGSIAYEGDHFRTFSEKKSFSDGRLIEKGYNPEPRRWVEIGDWVFHGPNAGLRLPIQDGEDTVIYRFLNDDELLGFIPDLQALLAGMPTLTYNLTT